jgi:radical SAM additional 4Fe4S-binding domain
MHVSNSDDFPGMISLAEKYELAGMVILGFKPDSSHELKSYPTEEQIRKVADQIRDYKGPIRIAAEPCFSQMKALSMRTFFGSVNTGVFRGCGAGRDGISVTVEGRLTPCRHLDVEESFEHIKDYWEQSEFIKQLREVEDNREEPCKGCRWEAWCLPCMAVGMKLHDRLNYGMKECPVAEPKKKD